MTLSDVTAGTRESLLPGILCAPGVAARDKLRIASGMSYRPHKAPLATRTRGTGTIPRSIVDDYLENYLRWREESEGVRRAYELWQRADRADAALAYAAYGAALDREQEAADAFCGRIECIYRSLGVHPSGEDHAGGPRTPDTAAGR